VCLVVFTGPVGPTLCCPANGTWLGEWFLDGGTHFCTNIYTDDHCLSHSVPLLVTLASHKLHIQFRAPGDGQ
jgi:hypothetical protein